MKFWITRSDGSTNSIEAPNRKMAIKKAKAESGHDIYKVTKDGGKIK